MNFNTYDYFCNIDLWLFLHFPLQKISTVMPLLCSRLNWLIILRPNHVTAYRKLPRSDNPIFAYVLRFLLWAWQLDSACNTVRYFTMSNLTLPHCRRTLRTTHFYALLSIDPYIRSFVRRSRHSHHIHFIDPRPIGYTIHLWTAFVLLSQITVSLSRLHRAFDKIGFPIMPIGVSGEAFRGVTPSFHFSDYQFYETDCINSFLFYTLYISTSRLTFSVRNVSHAHKTIDLITSCLRCSAKQLSDRST